MKRVFDRIRPFTVTLAAAVLLGGIGAGAAEPAAAKGTRENLQAAFNGESNASAKYTAFAKKADEEGYGQVASLFRAAARAEEIHAKAHAEVIKKLGAEPKADVKTPEVKSTADNLKAALAGETYERDEMYPAFIKQARAEKNKDALTTFNYAKTAEAEHAKFYQQAIDNLEQWKGGAKDFYVCIICGYTATSMPDGKCVSCFAPREKYVKVS